MADTTRDADPVISMRQVRKAFGTTVALDGLDLEVARGEVHGFLGPNGAGKSVTIRVLLGLLRRDAGEAQLLGGDPWHDAVELYKRLAQGNINDAEARFQQGLCELKLSRRLLSRGGKSNEPCILTFQSLIRARDFPLIERLKSERLTAEELYFLGFSLAEHSEAAQGLGGDILTLVAESDEDPKLRQMAHNKLVTMGFTE